MATIGSFTKDVNIFLRLTSELFQGTRRIFLLILNFILKQALRKLKIENIIKVSTFNIN